VTNMQHAPMATLRFFADDLSPDVISNIVVEKPMVAAAKGASIAQPRGRPPIKARVGTWFITTQGQDLGNRPDSHLAWVVRLAVEHLDSIRRRVPDVMADMSLLVHDADFNISDIPSDLLRRAVAIGELEIEIPEKGQDLYLNTDNLASHLTGKPL
jgi:hypothetical protein